MALKTVKVIFHVNVLAAHGSFELPFSMANPKQELPIYRTVETRHITSGPQKLGYVFQHGGEESAT